MKFLVTGCGRSGTQYATRLLRCCGLHVNHEAVFVLDNLHLNSIELHDLLDQHWKHGECSWFGVPFIKWLDPDQWTVIHLVRNPVNVIRSWASKDILANADYIEHLHGFIARTLGWTELPDNPVDLAAKYWVDWNSRIAKDLNNFGCKQIITTPWRVEELSTNPDLLVQLHKVMGNDLCEPKHVLSEMSCINRDVGSSAKAGWKIDHTIHLPSIRDSRLKDRVVADAIDYGYTEKELLQA